MLKEMIELERRVFEKQETIDRLEREIEAGKKKADRDLLVACVATYITIAVYGFWPDIAGYLSSL